MTDASHSDLAGLLQTLVQQQTAMLQAQAETARLQRVLVERLLAGAAARPIARDQAEDGAAAEPLGAPTAPEEHPAADPPPMPKLLQEHLAADPPPMPKPPEKQPAAVALAPPTPPTSVESAPADPPSVRGARYYQPRPAPPSETVRPEDLELMRRLQEMRDAGDLILQFGPYRGTTLAQVAMHHPEYVRELVTRAQRPEVRAAARRLVEALDAAAEHSRRPTHGAARHRRLR